MEYEDYLKTLDRSAREIENLYDCYKMYPDRNNMGDYAQKVLKELYRKTVKILDLKRQEEGTLSAEEEEIYQRCQRELTVPPRLRGLFRLTVRLISCILNGYESIFHLVTNGKVEGQIQKALFRAGEEVLPGYIGALTTLIDTFETYCTPDILLMPASMYDAARRGRDYRIHKADADKAFAEQMLHFADFGYSGKNNYNDFKPVKSGKLPEIMRPLYNEEIGLFQSGHGLRVWVAQKENTIVVSYSGTDPSNIFMDYEDFIQINTGSALYLEAAGFLKLLLKSFTQETLHVCGHSLGGGLAQFAVTANIDSLTNRIKCYAFNPAGLSIHSLNYLNDNRLKKSMNAINVYVTTKDKVSLSGAKLGNVVTLPATENNGHGMAALYACMKAYLKQLVCLKNEKVTEIVFFACTSPQLPEWKTACCSSIDETVAYPIFVSKPTSKQKFASLFMYEQLLKQIVQMSNTNCLGVYEYFNGDAFSVLNRLTILQEGNRDIPFTRESAASTVFFGPYGYGKKEWMEELCSLCSNSDSLLNRDNFDKYFARIGNEHELTLSAWLYILKNVYNYDFYDYFKNPTAKQKALEMIVNYSDNSKNLYKEYNFQRGLVKEELKSYLTLKSERFNNLLDAGFKQAVEYSMMPQSATDYIKSNIKEYLNNFIKTLFK